MGIPHLSLGWYAKYLTPGSIRMDTGPSGHRGFLALPCCDKYEPFNCWIITRFWGIPEEGWCIRAGELRGLRAAAFPGGHRNIHCFYRGCTCVCWLNVSPAHTTYGSLPFPTILNAHGRQGSCNLFLPPNEPGTAHIDLIHPWLVLGRSNSSLFHNLTSKLSCPNEIRLQFL